MCHYQAEKVAIFDMSGAELKPDLNHWVVEGGRSCWGFFCPTSSLKKANLKVRSDCSVSYPAEFWIHPRASQCWITVVVKIVLWYCSVSCCNLVVLVVCSSRAWLHLLPNLLLGGWRLREKSLSVSSWTNTSPLDSPLSSCTPAPRVAAECWNIHLALIGLNWVPVIMKMHWHKLQPGWLLRYTSPCALAGLSAALS